MSAAGERRQAGAKQAQSGHERLRVAAMQNDPHSTERKSLL
jgi:hypothetical protein